MIPALGKTALSTGYVLAGLFSCDPQPLPAITINFQNNPAAFNNQQPTQFMTQLRKDSISPGYGGEFPIVDGITSGNFQMEHTMEFSSTVRPFLGKGCVGVKAISIDLAYSATVYVDSRYPPGSCRYELTKDHEMKHVNTDVIIINETIPYIRKLIRTMAEQWQNMTPVPEDQLETAEHALSKQVSDGLEQASRSMQQLRGMRQQLVDSHEEYERVSVACPGEN